jgi:hypothetical protein
VPCSSRAAQLALFARSRIFVGKLDKSDLGLGEQRSVILAVAVLATAVPLGALASESVAHHAVHLHAAAPHVVCTLSKCGDNLRPLALTLYDTGRVSGFYTVAVQGGVRGKPNVRLSQDALAGLVKLAQAEGFAKMPLCIGQPSATSTVARSITMRIRTGERTVLVWTRGPAAFNHLYAVLLSVVGVPLRYQQ